MNAPSCVSCWCHPAVWGAVLCGCALTGCRTSQPARANIHSADAAERILAVRAIADKGDASAVPLLVDRLEDEDSAVQFFAIIALEKLTGRRFGYEVGQQPQQRTAAIERWRAFVERRGEQMSMNKVEGRLGGAAEHSPVTGSSGPPGNAPKSGD